MSERCKHCGRTIVRWVGSGKLWVHRDGDHTFCSMDDDDNNDRAEPSPEPDAALCDHVWGHQLECVKCRTPRPPEPEAAPADYTVFVDSPERKPLTSDEMWGEPEAPTVFDGGCLQHKDSPCDCREILDRMPDFLNDSGEPTSDSQAPVVPDEAPLRGWCSSCDRIDEPGNVECSTCGDTLIFSGEEADYLRNQLEGCAIVSRNYQDGVEYLKESGYGEQWKLVAMCRQSLDACIAELAQLRARVAILDAQEVELPELDITEQEKFAAGLHSDTPSTAVARDRAALYCRERQLLDAQRAVQAWREVARQQNAALIQLREVADSLCDLPIPLSVTSETHAAIAVYDALAGKGE